MPGDNHGLQKACVCLDRQCLSGLAGTYHGAITAQQLSHAGREPAYLHESRFLQRAFAVIRRDIAKSLDDVLAIVSPDTLAFEFCILVWRQVVNNGGVDCIRARGLYKCARR